MEDEHAVLFPLRSHFRSTALPAPWNALLKMWVEWHWSGVKQELETDENQDHTHSLVKGSTLQVQIDDLLTTFFDFNSLKPNTIHPRKIRRLEAHHGQLNVELTSTQKCLIAQQCKGYTKIPEERCWVNWAERKGKYGCHNDNSQMYMKEVWGCMCISSVWVLTKYFKAEDQITSRYRQVMFYWILLVTIYVFILKWAWSIIPTPLPWVCGVVSALTTSLSQGMELTEETTFVPRSHLKASKEQHGDLYLDCVFTREEACSLWSNRMRCEQ